MTKTKRLPDGYNGQTALFSTDPIERDGHLVKLRCAEPGLEYMTAWKRAEDLWAKRATVAVEGVKYPATILRKEPKS